MWYNAADEQTIHKNPEFRPELIFLLFNFFSHIILSFLSHRLYLLTFPLLYIKFPSYPDWLFFKGATRKMCSLFCARRLDFYDVREAFLKGFVTLTLVQAHRTAGKKGISRIRERAISDGVGSRKCVRLMHIRICERTGVYVDAGRGFGVLSQNHGGTPTRRDDWDGRGGQ